MKLTLRGWIRSSTRAAVCAMAMWLAGIAAQAQAVSTTTVQGTVYLANGQPAGGTLVVSWPTFTTAAGQLISAGQMTVTVGADGFVSVNLAPNQGATPAGEYYTAVFYKSDGTVSTEYWTVPAAAQASLAQVQAQIMPAAQAVQAVSKAYVDQAVSEAVSSQLSSSGGNLTGPLYLSGDPSQPLQAADKHYVDSSFSAALPLSGGTITGPANFNAAVTFGSSVTASSGIGFSGTGAAETLANLLPGAASDGANGMSLAGTFAPNATVSKVSPVFDIRAYGAVLDGAHDDGPAIRSAIAAAAANGGGEVYIPAGTAYIGGADPNDSGAFIGVQGNHVHIHCDERSKITTAPSSVLTLFRFAYLFNGRPAMQTTTSYNINPITYAGSSTIVLTTPTDISHFAVGDPIYIKGGPGIESNTDGEVNWVTALDPGTGTITLLKPTGKSYAGNVANGGSVTTASVADGGAWTNGNYSDTSAFYYDDSIDGCTATIGADFVFVGQIVGMRISNNNITVAPGATRGMMVNSYYPFADLTISHNVYTMKSATGSSIYQLAEGQRDVIIDGNDFTTVAGYDILNPSEGVLNASITNNKLYQTIPVGLAQSNIAPILTSTAYALVISGNSITLNNPNSTQQHAIELGLSNGTCLRCVVSHNTIILNGGNGYAISESGGTQKPVVNIASNNIQTTKGGMTLSGNNVVSNNMIYMMGAPGGSNAIIFGSGDTVVTGNLIYSTNNTVNGIVMNSASGTALIEGNLIDNAADAVGLQNGALPFIANNQCVNVTDTGHYCNSISWSDVQFYRSGSGVLKTNGALAIAPASTSISGTSGTATCLEDFRGTVKRASCYLNGYAQTGTAQTYSFPTAFSTTPLLLESGGSCGTYNPTATATTLTLPANAAMAAETCNVVAMGQ